MLGYLSVVQVFSLYYSIKEYKYSRLCPAMYFIRVNKIIEFKNPG